MAAVNRNMFDASIITERPGGASLMVLPLNLIAQIVTNVEDTGDLARLCRTCRVLNYMALPQLYRDLTLNSYDKIRYRDDQPEGIGSASPFTMGLNAVITRPFATLVRSMTLRGDWKEHALEEHAQVGRVPDSSMLLNIAVRAAVDRMTSLESFSWELNTKMLDTVYAGLIQLPRLHSLTIRFPSTRHPQPTHVLPPMPHLRALKITDIDPLCYPDDISTLLWKSKKLRDLRLHWSPRMRIAQEPSVSVHDYFRKAIAARQPLSLRRISFQNMYAFHSEEFNIAFDPTMMEDVSFLSGTDSFGLTNTFVENSWPVVPPHKQLRIKSFRVDAVSKRNAEFLGNFKGLERIYFVNVTPDNPDYLNSPRPASNPATSALTPPISEHHNFNLPNSTAANSPATLQSPVGQPNPVLSGRDSYLSNITMNHGASLRHLLLSSKWPLSTAMIARLVHSCPNLEQLALATDVSSMESVGMLVPFLRKLVAIRLLIPAGSPAPQSGPPRNSHNSPANYTESQFMKARQVHTKAFSSTGKVVKLAPEVEEAISNARSLADIVDVDDDLLTSMIGYDLADKQVFGTLKIMGIGWKAFELRGYYKSPMPLFEEEMETPIGQTPDENGNAGNREIGATVTFANTPDGQASVSNSTSPDINGNPATTRSSHTPHTPGVSMPPSSLGKRSRNDEDGASDRQSHEARDSVLRIAMCDSNAILADDGQIWRRHMRRVGWDVLKNWEIWSLDTQDI
ncbi:hypothetical protein N7478_005026 [Penicillium angulare]|uniref:uncharacterized protein n=1 Tax=Penicillium angulare TaxID=116970 RepID=UPI002541B4D6|nr:uncharacterized protein N7478_005026 [Penicillium angulare]KAJ5279654.1 hypothetical protein N7478_005026 [Penicillium angulare]